MRRADPELEHDLDQRLPHPRGRLDCGAGARVHARERIAYAQAAVDAGLSPDEFGAPPPSSSTRTTTSSRRWRSSAPRGGCGRRSCASFGATNPKALALRFHAQTGGSTLTAQQPENNIVRVAIQALSAVAGGAQSLHTNGFDEALALPTSARRGSRCARSILAAEGGAADTADPLGGSYFIESLTDELEAGAS